MNQSVSYYGFSFYGNEAHCREGYADAEGALAHLENVGQLLEEALKMVELTRLGDPRPGGGAGQAPQTSGETEPAILHAGVWLSWFGRLRQALNLSGVMNGAVESGNQGIH